VVAVEEQAVAMADETPAQGHPDKEHAVRSGKRTLGRGRTKGGSAHETDDLESSVTAMTDVKQRLEAVGAVRGVQVGFVFMVAHDLTGLINDAYEREIAQSVTAALDVHADVLAAH
jgi:hypothetical protein